MSTPPSSPHSPASAASHSPNCPRCGRPIPANAVLGACPHCLLAAGLTSEPAACADAAPPPTPAELTPEFPQLEILELLGRGGMGAVYKARQKSLDRFVALKLLRPGLDADPSFAERFAREARALAQLNHPGIVTLYEFGHTPGGLYFILMEFVDGLNLRQLLAAGRLSPREALAIIPPLCDALQYAHDRGLIHRDIKPENLLIDRLGRMKIADFGLAKLTATTDLKTPSSSNHSSPLTLHSFATGHSADGETVAGQIFGTPGYMAPEQRERPATVDHRADIYALGVVLYQMLTGELPDAKQLQPPSHRVQLDIRLDEIVLRALATNPTLRYAAISELKTQVENLPAPLDDQKPAVLPTEGTPAPVARKTFRTAAITFGLLYALHLVWVFSSSHELPAKVASHFGISGRANGFMGKSGYIAFTCLLPLSLALFLQATARLAFLLPDQFINVPHRKIWLSPERRPELIGILTSWLAALSCGLVILFAQIHALTLLANRLQPPRLPEIALFSLIGFPTILMLWLIGLIMRLAEPLAPAKLHTRRTLILLIISAALLGLFAAPAVIEWQKHDLPPQAATSSSITERRFPNDPIRIRQDGSYAIGATQVSLEELHQHLARIGRESPDSTVLIEADEKMAYTLMPGIMTTGRRLGISKFAIKTLTPEAKTPGQTASAESADLREARTALAEARTRYLDGHPLVQAIQNRIAALEWLHQIDAGSYGRSWASASPFFRQSLTEAEWIAWLQAVRAPLGAVASRHFESAQGIGQPLGSAAGPHIFFRFSTRFEHKSDAIETVTFTRDDDGVYRASGYFIK